MQNEVLERKLDDWLKNSTLLLVQAPTGFGKTTAIAHWLASLGDTRTVIWISCGQWIHSWKDALLALEAALADTGVLPQNVGDSLSGPNAFARLVAARDQFVIVYDDYDLLTDAPDVVQQAMADRQLPGSRTIVIRSGRDARSGSVEPAGTTVMTEADLRWTEEMVQDAFLRSKGTIAQQSLVKDLLHATDGAPSVTMRVVSHEAASPHEQARGRRVRPLDLVVDWALDAARRSVPVGRAEGVFHLVALAPSMPRALLAILTEADDLDRVLGALENGRLVTAHRNRPGDLWYEIPDRFLDIARTRAEEAFGDGVRVLHLSAAEYHASAGHVELQLYHLARAGLVEQMLPLLVTEMKERRGRADAVQLRAAMAALPDEVFLDAPDLLAARVLLSRLPPTDPRRRRDLEGQLIAISPSDLRELPLQRRVIVIAAKVAVLLSRGRLDEALALGRQFVSPSASSGWEVVPNLMEDLSTLLLFTGEASILAANPRDGILLVQRARAVVPDGGGEHQRYRHSSLLALGYAMSGDARLAEDALDDAKAVSMHLEDLPPAIAYQVPLAEAFLAARGLQPGPLLAAAEQFGSFVSDAPIWPALSKIFEAYGEYFAGYPERGLAALRELMHGSRSVGAPHLFDALAVGLAADLRIAVGKPGVAVRELESVEQPDGHALCLSVPLASAHLAIGEPLLALADTDSCLALGTAHALRPLPSVFVRRAIAHEILGHQSAADEAFLEAFLLIRSSPTLAPFVNVSRAVTDVLMARLAYAHPELKDDLDRLTAEFVRVERFFLRAARDVVLSRKEKLVLGLLSESRTVAQIGEELFVSPNTIKSQISSIYRKLGVKTRKEAISAALAMGLSPRDV